MLSGSISNGMWGISITFEYAQNTGLQGSIITWLSFGPFKLPTRRGGPLPAYGLACRSNFTTATFSLCSPVLFVFASLALQGIGWLHSADLVILKIDPASAATAWMINLHKF